MALQIENVIHTCRLITREIKDYQKNLAVHFIVHHEGQQTEALGLAAQNIQSHPASETAMHFLQKQRRSDNSVLLGTAVARQKLFFGLATRDTILSLCTINIDQFDNLKEITHSAYHLAWHALDSARHHGNPNNRIGRPTEIIVRKRNALEMSGFNLQADIFSAILSDFHGDKKALRSIAIKRGQDILHTRSLHRPEFYPFTIVMESTEFALKQVNRKKLSKKKFLPMALRIAKDVGRAYDDISLKHWLSLAEPAQEMAWQGYSEEEILSAAVNTSANTYVRANGYLISELTAIKPTPVLDISENYSAYTDDDFNEKLHEKLINETYQDIIAQGGQQNSSLPFLTMANQQNKDLTGGDPLGWCASALHAAGTAYDTAKENDNEAESLAREKFKSEKEKTKWKNLQKLGSNITKRHRQGQSITLGDLKEMTNDIKGLSGLKRSVEKTISDQNYQNQLAASNELRPEYPGLKPAAKTPDIIPKIIPKTPVPEMVSIPGLGGVRNTLLRHNHQKTEKEKEKEEKTDKK